MTDFLSQIDAVHREVGASGKATRMLMRRSYDGSRRGRLGRAHRPRPATPLVPAGLR